MRNDLLLILAQRFACRLVQCFKRQTCAGLLLAQFTSSHQNCYLIYPYQADPESVYRRSQPQAKDTLFQKASPTHHYCRNFLFWKNLPFVEATSGSLFALRFSQLSNKFFWFTLGI